MVKPSHPGEPAENKETAECEEVQETTKSKAEFYYGRGTQNLPKTHTDDQVMFKNKKMHWHRNHLFSVKSSQGQTS